MQKPNTDPTNVQMSDILCDFCHREWTEEVAMIEGHQGSCICGRCLALARAEMTHGGSAEVPPDLKCSMCLEAGRDREAMGRAGEALWQSPLHPEAVICRRCVDQAASALQREGLA